MIKLLTGDVGKVVVIVALFLAWTAYQRNDAAREAREECQADQLQKTVDETRRQLEAANQSAKEARDQAARSEREMAALRRDLESINDDAAQLSSSTCVVPDALRSKLQNIR